MSAPASSFSPELMLRRRPTTLTTTSRRAILKGNSNGRKALAKGAFQPAPRAIAFARRATSFAF